MSDTHPTISPTSSKLRLARALGAIAFVLVGYVGYDIYTRGVVGATSPPSAVQVVCYGQNGQPLFPPQVAKSAKVGDVDDPIEVTYENGMHAWIRASSCIAAQMTVDDLAAIKSASASKAPTPPSPPSPPPAPPAPPTKTEAPAALQRAAESYQAEHANLVTAPPPGQWKPHH